jgi:hypothetical protein
MSLQSPVGTLDIKNATLRVGKLEVSNIQGVDTALNVTRANSVLIYDDQASTTTFTGFTSSPYVRDTVNGYLEVADGYVYWGQKLPNSWVMDFEMDIRSGTNPGPLYANVFSTTNTGGDGYSFTFNDSNDKISLYYDSTLLTEATVTGLFTASEDWRKVVINYERGMIAISLDGSRKFYYKDIERSTPYVNGEYTNFSSASTDGRKIRNLRIVNGEKWMYTGESNIAYTQGSVGIGVTDPQYTLDVGGDINLSGSFYQGGSPFVSSLWTDGGDSLYYRSNVEVGTANLFVDTTTSRVGIGTRTPGYDLDVNGDINFTGTFYQGGSPFVSSLWTSGNDSLYYTASNVGIGTDTAEYTLDVHGNANVGALTTTSVSGDGSALYGIQSSNVSDFASNVTRIGTLETDLDDNSSRISTISTDLSDNSTRISTVSTDLSDNSSRISTISTDLGDNSSRISTISTDLSDNSTRISTVSTDLSDNSSRISTISTDLSDNSSRISSVESGTHTFTGKKTFTEQVTFESNIHVKGDLLVANTVNMTVSDPILELGSNNLNTGDIGLVMTRHGASNSNVAVFFDESEDVLKLGYTLNGANDTTLEFDSNALAVSVQGALTAASISGPLTGNADTAAALETARTIGGVSFDGTANIDLPGVNTIGNQDTSGNAATAAALETARTIGGVSFDGTANIDLPGVNTAGTQNTSGNAATATALETARNIGGVSFDGSANIDLPGVNTIGNQDTSGNAATATALETARTIGGVSFDGTANIDLPGVNTIGNQDTTGNADTATALETARTIGGVSFDGTANIDLPGVNTAGTQNTSGNAATATALETARAINGVNFDGSAAITVNGTKYNVNDVWLRENGDNAHFRQYGNSRQMVFRTDGTTEYFSGVGAYPFAWMYGGDAASNRRMLLSDSGQLWCSNYGWLHDKFVSRNTPTSQTFTDNVANTTFSGHTIDHNCSGSDACTTDRPHRALFIDMDSSATGGDTNHEHRLYGIYNDVRHTGDSDLVYGMYTYTRSDHTSGTTTNLRAGDFIAIASGTGTNTNVFGISAHALKDAGSSGTTANMYGVRGEVEVDAGTCTNAYAFQSHIDRDGGTITNGYLYYGSYSGTVGTKWGVYVTGETKNYFSGSVGIGTADPQGGLHVYQKTLVLGELSTNPSSSPNGSMYYNTTYKRALIKIDGSWRIMGGTFSPASISGLVGWYLPENWTGSQWTDISGSGNNVTEDEGTINYTSSHDGSTVGAQSTFPVLYGDTSAELNFPSAILPSTYTLIALTRYNGTNKKRILDGQDTNWLSGHWLGKSGVAYHGGWLTTQVDRHGSKWVLSTDQNNLYRSKSESVAWEESNTGAGSGGATYANLRVGSVGYEPSDWMCAEIIVYNRTLSSDEYGLLETYMQNKYNIY